ncbi:MAG TPA: AraC family transcriptional regulator ligand-binding domain-containing protein [Polyangiaceae bacterium]|jgi:AraC-like DNA-binding protein|nr:AraC family transcriptional regulator ligand-binding domain-containing protein [Polyangiaceae bacterium]
MRRAILGPDLTISARLLLPFARALSTDPAFHSAELDDLRALDPDGRVSLSWAHELLRGAVERTRDPDLGLRAGRHAEPSDYGVIHYAIRSAPTVNDAIMAAQRYMRLLTDAIDYRLELDGERAMVRLDSKVPLPRASADYQASITQTLQLAPYAGLIPGLEWWFTHERPADTSVYEEVFAPATVRFSAPAFGYCFDRAHLDFPLPQADPNLNQIVKKHAELLLAELPRTRNVTESVRDLIIKELAGGQPTAAQVAVRLRMNQRTLARRLQSEGTTFSALFDDLRRSLALRYLLRTDLRISEVVFMLGFSEVATFYRAFRRWTGQTPVEYRRSQGGVLRTDRSATSVS